MNEVYGIQRGQAEAKQITLSLDLQPDPPPLVGDYFRLMFALRELVENALRYTPEGGSVTMRTRANDGQMCLEVADTGIGMDAAAALQIFDPYFKISLARTLDHSGLGLGLTFVKKITESHGGRVEVQSTPGQGSVLRLILPVGESSV